MGETAIPEYDARAVEERQQAAWAQRDAFRAPPIEGLGAGGGVYIKASAPFTSGNVHIGHVRSYAIGDAYARFQRARGRAVLFAFGFDAFGLPAELGAIANGESPSEWVARCARHMTGQLRRLGFSFNWERTFMSSDPLMYRWSQWLFLVLLDAGLIYHGTGTVDWCDTCQTTLATIQVENGTCWRCHNPVRLIQRPQWYLRISAYVSENDRRAAGLGKWDETSLASQADVLGRTDGFELDARVDDGGELTLFTPHAEGAALARFALISPKHPDVERLARSSAAQAQLEELRLGGLERSSRAAEAMALVDTGHSVSLPDGAGGFQELPLAISPAVDERFGPTAVLGVPALDRTDAIIAQRLGLVAEDAGHGDGGEQEQGVAADTCPSPAGAAEVSQSGGVRARAHAHARPAVRYRADDFTISRQRAWGTPIPIVYCERCGTVPLRREQLPIELPLDLKPTGAGNPLAEREDFVQTACPACGGPARRETDTLDCHFDALWLWVPACVPAEQRERPLEEIFALPDLRAWLPSERLVAGSDSGNFMFDQRITTKALRDIGPLAFLADGEPFAGALMHEMVIRDGRKMSKHLGNVVDPDELVESFGADTVRLAVLWAARPQKSLNWDDSAVQYCARFLHNLWRYSHARLQMQAADEPELDPAATEHLRRRLDKWCETGVQKITEELAELEMHKAVRDVIRLLDRIKDFEKKVIQRSGALGREDLAALLDALALMAQVLAPFAPHVAQELWLAAGRGEPGVAPPWPSPTAAERGPANTSRIAGEPSSTGTSSATDGSSTIALAET